MQAFSRTSIGAFVGNPLDQTDPLQVDADGDGINDDMRIRMETEGSVRERRIRTTKTRTMTHSEQCGEALLFGLASLVDPSRRSVRPTGATITYPD